MRRYMMSSLGREFWQGERKGNAMNVHRLLRYLNRLMIVAFMAGTATGAAGQATPSKITVVMPAAPETYMLSFFVAEDAGFYRDAGLSVDIKTVNGNQNTLRAIITGAGDVAVVGHPIMYEAIVNGAKLKGIGGGNQTLMDYYLVLAKGKGTQLKDAAGKILAISTPGSMPQLIPEMMFRENKIDSSGTRYVAVGSISVRLQAVLAGKVDGTLLDAINTLRGERLDKVVTVASANAQIAEPLAYTISVVTDEALKDAAKRDALGRFVKATMQGARRSMEQPKFAAQVMQKRLGGDVDLGLLEEVVAILNKDKVWGVNGGVEKKLHDVTMPTYLQYKLISKPVDYADAFEPLLAAQAVKELGEIQGLY
jgi:ABC-type nitrate/sulfonate/bicarbonate transport system substrate-binding protein